MELAESEELYSNPQHPYTKSLLAAVPIPDPAIESEKMQRENEPLLTKYDFSNTTLVEVSPGHYVAQEIH